MASASPLDKLLVALRKRKDKEAELAHTGADEKEVPGVERKDSKHTFGHAVQESSRDIKLAAQVSGNFDIEAGNPAQSKSLKEFINHPSNLEIVPTEVDRKLCGLKAICLSAAYQYPELTPPTVARLQRIAKSAGIPDILDFADEHLHRIIQIWFAFHDRDVGLAIQCADQLPFAFAPQPDQRYLYLHNNAIPQLFTKEHFELTDHVFGPWSGMRSPAVAPKEAENAAEQFQPDPSLDTIQHVQNGTEQEKAEQDDDEEGKIYDEEVQPFDSAVQATSYKKLLQIEDLIIGPED